MKLLQLTPIAALVLTVNSLPADPPVYRQQPMAVSDDVGVSAVPVGQIITQCTVPGTFAITFDDGPYIYTDQILDILRNNGVKATFFVNGQNFGNINDPAETARVQRAINEGHQVGSHTWDHADLTTLDRAGIVSEMDRLSDALRNIIGKVPRYMRSPYFASNDFTLQTLGELNFHVIHASIDTLDYSHDSQDAIQTSVQLFKDGLNQGGTIELSHDVHQWTANVLVQEMINAVKAKGLQAVTVGDCLGDPPSNWYL